MKLKVRKTTIEDVELEIKTPSFYANNDKSEAIGIFPNDVAMYVRNQGIAAGLSRSSHWGIDYKIEEAVNKKWEKISKEEFDKIYNIVLLRCTLADVLPVSEWRDETDAFH